MVSQVYQPELQLNGANASEVEASLLALRLSISIGVFFSKFMINEIALNLILYIFFFLDGAVPP